MSSKDPSDSWRTQPDVGSASGGHLVPEPPNSALYGRSPDPQRTQPLRATPRQEEPPRRQPAKRPPRRRGPIRRVRRQLRHIDPVSVLKISIFFYIGALIVWMLFVGIFYAMLGAFGVFELAEGIADAFAFDWENQITLFFVERWAFTFGLLFVVLASLFNVLLAFVYNVVADFMGGIEMTFVEREM